MFKKLQTVLCGILLTWSFACHAAVVNIDDTDINDISIEWSGFDSFYLNDSALTTNLGGSGAATFSDAAELEFVGLYTVADIIDASFEFVLGSEVGAPGDYTSGIGADISAYGPSGQGGARVGGAAIPYIGGFVYGSGVTSYEQGDTVTLVGSEMTITFVSEAGEIASVPAPASLLLMCLALLGFALGKRTGI